MLSDPVVYQPTSFTNIEAAPGSTPVNGVTIRYLQNTPEDAEFAGKLTVEGFRGKIAHCVTERK